MDGKQIHHHANYYPLVCFILLLLVLPPVSQVRQSAIMIYLGQFAARTRVLCGQVHAFSTSSSSAMLFHIPLPWVHSLNASARAGTGTERCPDNGLFVLPPTHRGNHCVRRKNKLHLHGMHRSRSVVLPCAAQLGEVLWNTYALAKRSYTVRHRPSSPYHSITCVMCLRGKNEGQRWVNSFCLLLTSSFCLPSSSSSL